MLLSQNPFAPREPREARAAGIGMVFQHFSLFEALSVAENIAKSRPSCKAHHGPPIASRSLRGPRQNCILLEERDW